MYDFIIPKMGEGDIDIEIMDIKVKVGDFVKEGDPIVEAESEKASTILESEKSGIVEEVLLKKGDTVKVGAVVCRIKEQWNNI